MTPNVGRTRGESGSTPRLAPNLIRRRIGSHAQRRDHRRRAYPGRPPGRAALRVARHRPGRPAAGAVLKRNDLDPSLVEDVVMGCTMTVGEQAMNIARNAALAAGFPESVPGTTVDRQCGSAQQAIHFAAQAVMAGAMDVAIGAGVESMSRVPIGSTTEPGPGEAYGPLYLERFELIHQGECAEEIARRWNMSPRGDGRAARCNRTNGRPGRPTRDVSPTRSCHSRRRCIPTCRGRRRAAGFLRLTRACGATRSSRSWPRCGRLLRDRHGDGRNLLADIGRGGGRADHERGAGDLFGASPRARFHTFAVAANDPQIMLTRRFRRPSWSWRRRSSARRDRRGGDQRGLRVGGAGLGA